VVPRHCLSTTGMLIRFVVEPFVRGVERGNGDVDDAHVSDGAMAAAGLDEDGGHGADGVAFAIELDAAFPFEDEVDLSHFLVVVDAGVGADIDHVEGGDMVVGAGEGAAGGAAGAGDGVELVELFDFIVRHGGDSSLVWGKGRCPRAR